MAAERYDDAVDLTVANDSHSMVVRAVARGSRVLDLGCSTGRLAGTLTARGCEVVGVDADPASVAAAADRCARAVMADLETADAELRELGEFDVVVCADVLEHLKDPARLLRVATDLLRPGGYVVASVPNVAHGSVRLALLAGAFPYQETGLLDDTHLRFYTDDTLEQMLVSAGLEVLYVDTTRMPPLDGSVLKDVDVAALPPAAVQAVRDDPRAADYQYVVVAQPVADDSGPLYLVHRADERLRAARAEIHGLRDGLAVDDGPEVVRQLTEAAVRSEAVALLSYQRIQAAEQALARALETITELEERLDREGAAGAAELARAVAVEQARATAAEETLQTIYASRLWRTGQAYRRARHRFGA